MTLLIITVCTAVFTGGHVITNGVFTARGLVPVDFMYAVFHPSMALFEAGGILVASFFMHGGPGHLLGNMWYLWLFGPAVERRIGGFPFIILYFSCGIISLVIQTLSSPLSKIPVVGASGAIAGIMGCSLLLLPLARFACYVPPVFIVRIPAYIFLLLWFIIQYINVRHGNGASTMVAWWAHIGGYATGAIAGTVLLGRGRPGRSGVRKR